MSVINLFLIGCISRDFFCFLLNPLQLIHLPLETQCARLRPSQCWSRGRRISSRVLHVTLLFIHPRNVSFFATGWHSGLEFSLSFTITSSSFLRYCSIVIMLHSLSLWLFIYVGRSINLVVVFKQWLCYSSQLPQAGEIRGSSWLAPTTLPSKFPGRALNQVRAFGPWQARTGPSLP